MAETFYVNGAGKAGPLDRLDEIAAHIEGQSHPPVASWSPSHVGEIDIVIKRDGSWLYQNSPITRPGLVKLFSSILLREEDGQTHLVTPVEKLAITLEDAPFVAVDMEVGGAGEAQKLAFRTNVDDYVIADEDHPIFLRSFEGSVGESPYIHVRDGLDALIARPVYYRLAELAEPLTQNGAQMGVWSSGDFFPLGMAE